VTLAVTGDARAGAVATIVLAAQPGLLYIGRSEAPTAAAILLMLLAAWLIALAARHRTPALLALATVALAALASMRLVGPVVAGPVALLALAAPSPAPGGDRLRGARWGLALVAAATTAVLLAAPHLLRVWAAAAETVATAEGDPFGTLIVTDPVWSIPALTFLGAAGLLVALATRPLLGVALTLAAALVIFTTRASVDTWANVPRYQTWLVVYAALAGGVAVAWLSRLGRPRAVGLALALVAAWAAADIAARWPNQSAEHPAAAELRLWRDALAALPPDAVLVVPLESAGVASASLPDAELAGSRPDVTLVGYRAFAATAARAGRQAFWFQPSYCLAQVPDAPVVAASDCRQAPGALRLTPVHVEGVPTRAPTALVRLGLAERVWTQIPFLVDPAPLGLYRIAAGP
jgi:hypothetical protein